MLKASSSVRNTDMWIIENANGYLNGYLTSGAIRELLNSYSNCRSPFKVPCEVQCDDILSCDVWPYFTC